MSASRPSGRPRPHSVSGVFPSLDRMGALLPLLHGVDRRDVVGLSPALAHAARAGGLTDTAAIVAACDAPLGRTIWEGTEGLVEPGTIPGYWDVASRYRLLVSDGFTLRLTAAGRDVVERPDGRTVGWIAGREGLSWIVGAVAEGATTLEALLPGWRAVLEGNLRFRSPASHPRSLGQRCATLVRSRLLDAHGDHAARLSDETGFRSREPEPAFAGLGGGLALTGTGRTALG